MARPTWTFVAGDGPRLAFAAGTPARVRCVMCGLDVVRVGGRHADPDPKVLTHEAQGVKRAGPVWVGGSQMEALVGWCAQFD